MSIIGYSITAYSRHVVGSDQSLCSSIRCKAKTGTRLVRGSKYGSSVYQAFIGGRSRSLRRRVSREVLARAEWSGDFEDDDGSIPYPANLPTIEEGDLAHTHRWEAESTSEKLEEELHRYLGDIVGPVMEPVMEQRVCLTLPSLKPLSRLVLSRSLRNTSIWLALSASRTLGLT
eukprot:3191673-Pyramimonas_sp.AAC.3